jgi:hypothetical protein
MATNLLEISQYLDNREWRYHLESEKSRIITGVKADHVEDFLIVISLKEDGEYLELAAPQLLQVKDHVYKGVLFQTMLAISWQVKMLRWEYDPSDGEIRASIGFPLEDSPLTEKQFNRVLSGLIQLVDEMAMPRLKTVLATGEDPGEKQMGEQLLDAMEQAFPEMVELLAQAIEARKQKDVI